MRIVVLTAAGVGLSTVIGAIIGFAFHNLSHKFSDIILSFAAGVMLCAATVGLIIPSYGYGGNYAVFTTVAGLFSGAFILSIIDKLVPHLHRMSGNDIEIHKESKKTDKLMLFVTAVAIHNLPEGIAAGVGFGAGNIGDALAVALGIAFQNIPEGMVIIAPMIAAGTGKGKAFLIAALTGAVEVVGTFLGYFAVSFSTAVLPFSLAFAGGTMLYVISDEMIPETHHEGTRGITYALFVGFALMLIMDFYVG